MRYRVMLLGLAVPALVLAQQPEQSMPRFRAGANLVRVDAYVSKDDVALTDLTADDFTVFEDDKPQRVESFELIRARGPVPENERRDVNNTRDMRQQVADAARVFTLFFDPLYTSVSGSYHLQKPLVETLDKVIGPDDMVGAMTPEMPPSAITYSKRTESIEQFVTKNWMWGQRDVSGRCRPSCTTPSQEDAIARVLSAVRQGVSRYRRRDDRAAPRRANARRARVAGRAPRRPAAGAEVRDGLHRGLAAVPSRSGRCRASSKAAARFPIRSPSIPATGGIRPQGGRIRDRQPVTSLNACERLRIQLSQIDHENDFLVAAAARQPRERQLLSGRCARPAGVRSTDELRRPAVRRSGEPAPASRFPARHGAADRWLRGAQHRARHRRRCRRSFATSARTT